MPFIQIVDSLSAKSDKPSFRNGINTKTSNEEERNDVGDASDDDDDYDGDDDDDEDEDVDERKRSIDEKLKKSNAENSFSGNDMDVSYSSPTYGGHPRVIHSLQSLPLNSRNKIQNLMNFIKFNAGDEITWDQKGLVTINGRVMKKSNIIDLVREVTVIRPKKVHSFSQPPPGFMAFSKVLKKHNIPRTLVGNKSRLSEIFNSPLSTPRNQFVTRRKRKNSFSPYGFSPSKQVAKFLLEDV